MRIFIIGAGQVGSTIVEALHDEHELTVVDTDAGRLERVGRYDVGTVEGDGASRRVLEEAGLSGADLVIACTSRDEINVIASMFARRLAPDARTIVRTGNEEYLDVWRERQLDVDWVVSSERETALAVSQTIGVPAARQTDVFADGQVQIVEFDVAAPQRRRRDESGPLLQAAERAARQRHRGLRFEDVVGRPLREAVLPADSKVASIIRGDSIAVPRGEETIRPGDRIVVIGSPQAAKEWSRLLTPARRTVDDIVIFGAGRIGTATARALLQQGIRVRLVESDPERARAVSELLPKARVFCATGTDPEFLEREHVGRSDAAVFAMRDDAKNYYAATLAKLHGVELTIAVVHDTVSVDVFERAGVDVAINPRLLTAEEIVRFARDPRTRQVAMLDQDRFEVLDITVRPESKLAGKRFRDLPTTGSLIGAVIREGQALFPHGDDVLEAGDRAILFTPSSRVHEVEKTL
jgi:trk system potassium uptake protein